MLYSLPSLRSPTIHLDESANLQTHLGWSKHLETFDRIICNLLYPCADTWPTTRGPTLQQCAINLSSCIRAADAPTTHTLSTAAQHMADPAILSNSERYSLVTYAQHTRAMVLNTHHHTATLIVATTVATQAQGAIDEQSSLQRWVLAPRS